MAGDSESTGIPGRARALLQSGEIGSVAARRSGRVGQPIPVRRPDGGVHSWFVPVTVGDRLAGFFEFLPDLTLMRYSSFQRQEDSVEGCPPADSWIDADTVRRRVDAKARPGERVGEPYLTFDREPSRLAWAAILTSPGGATRTLYIAGDAIWEASPPSDSFGSFGGK